MPNSRTLKGQAIKIHSPKYQEWKVNKIFIVQHGVSISPKHTAPYVTFFFKKGEQAIGIILSEKLKWEVPYDVGPSGHGTEWYTYSGYIVLIGDKKLIVPENTLYEIDDRISSSDMLVHQR